MITDRPDKYIDQTITILGGNLTDCFSFTAQELLAALQKNNISEDQYSKVDITTYGYGHEMVVYYTSQTLNPDYDRQMEEFAEYQERETLELQNREKQRVIDEESSMARKAYEDFHRAKRIAAKACGRHCQ